MQQPNKNNRTVYLTILVSSWAHLSTLELKENIWVTQLKRYDKSSWPNPLCPIIVEKPYLKDVQMSLGLGSILLFIMLVKGVTDLNICVKLAVAWLLSSVNLFKKKQ